MGKSYFVIPVPDMNAANVIISNHLQSYGFQYLGQYSIILDGMNIIMTGYKCQSAIAASFIEYAVCNNKVYMFGYANSPDKPLAIDDNSLFGGLAKTDAISKIMPLVQNLQAMGVYSNQSPNGYYSPTPTATQNTIRGVENATNTYAIVALIIGIASFLTSFFGSAMGLVVIGIGFYVAAMGMKMQKSRGMCIAAIVLLSIDMIMNIIMVLIAMYVKTR